MKIEQITWPSRSAPELVEPHGACDSPQLVFVFAASTRLTDADTWLRLRERWPDARVVACSTAGEISGVRVLDDSVVATALQLDTSQVRCARVDVSDWHDSEALGRALAERLAVPDLRHVFVLSDGLKVNGSALVRGLAPGLPAGGAGSGAVG